MIFITSHFAICLALVSEVLVVCLKKINAKSENLRCEVSASRIKFLYADSVMEGGVLPSTLARSNVRCRGFAFAWKHII